MVVARSHPRPGWPDGWLNGAVREHGVDAVLAEAAVAGILSGAEATGLPTAALMANTYLRPTPGLPQVGTGRSPARGPIGRFRDALVAMALHRMWATGLPALNAVGAAHGLSPVSGQLPVRALLTTSPAVSPEEVQAPPNVRVLRAAPHQEVLREASAVVTHAGHGSVLKAPRRRTPRLYAVGSRPEGQRHPRAQARRGGASEQEGTPCRYRRSGAPGARPTGLRTCCTKVCGDRCG
jgi:hypothetical protein